MKKRTPASFRPSDFSEDVDEGVVEETEHPEDYQTAVRRLKEFMQLSVVPRNPLLCDLITEQSITIINGVRGHGKSWLVLALADAIAWGKKVGPWGCGKTSNVLYIDGEMTIDAIQERISRLNAGKDMKTCPSDFYVYAESYAYTKGLYRASLLNDTWRSKVKDMCLKYKVGLLVLDNLSSLAPGIDENDKMQFDAVNRWLLEMRFHKLAIVMTHHVGKSGSQRGTTAHEDHVDLSLQLTRPRNYRMEDGCKFVCRVTKDRAHITIGMEYTMQLVDVGGGGVEFGYIEGDVSLPIEKAKEFVRQHPNATVEDAEKAGIKERTFFRAKRETK